MLSYKQILVEVASAAEVAKRLDKKPLSVRLFRPEAPRDFLRKIPFLGDYIPEGWEDSGFEPWLCDATGADNFGPALSTTKLAAKIADLQRSTPDHFGLGIIEAGEFQVVIRVFKTDHRDFTKSGALTEDDLRKVGSR